ncbi:MAG: hypothetical protein AB1393_00885 [Candidatus Edwardsbacteria bacterium]
MKNKLLNVAAVMVRQLPELNKGLKANKAGLDSVKRAVVDLKDHQWKIAMKQDSTSLALSEKIRTPNLKGLLSKKEAVALIKQSGLEIGKVQEDNSLFVADTLKKTGYEPRVGPTGMFFVNPVSKDTIMSKPNVVYMQEPAPGTILSLEKGKVDFRIITISPKQNIPPPAFPSPKEEKKFKR